MRHLLRYLLFFVSLLLPLAEAAAQSSAWWYPRGNPLGTRNNPEPTAQGTDSADLVVKWRSPLLKNSPTILVGAIRTSSPSDRRQQVVGLAGDILYILSDSGVVEQRYDYSPDLGNMALTLTGLFNPLGGINPTNPGGTPNLPNRIGIGARPLTAAVRPLRGVLADNTGTIRSTIAVPELATASGSDKIAGVYPVAAYSGGVLAAVHQDDFTATGIDTTINSIRKYSVGGQGEISFQWSYPIAPGTYPQSPSFLPDPASPSVLQIGVSTSTYPVHADVIPQSGRRTFTDTMYSVQIDDRGNNVVRHYATLAVTPPGFPQRRSQGEAHSYFMAMTEPLGGEENFRVVTENHDAARPGRTRLWLVPAAANGENPDSIYAAFTPWRLLQREDLGLTIVAADIDGNGRDRSISDNGRFYYTNNPADELIAAYAEPAGGDLEENYLFALRRDRSTVGGGRETFGLEPFIQYPFQGRLLAAGDLIGDATLRRELVIAYRDTIRILQLQDYDHRAFNRLDTVRHIFFDTLGVFPLGENIVSVAIADLEADGINDLIVNTAGATYAIGTRLPRPFGTIAPEQRSYCPGDSVKIRWSRRAGGGQDGVRVTLMRGAEPLKVLAHRHLLAGGNPLNPGVGRDSIIIPTTGLAPGAYRIRVEDTVVASLDDFSAEFTIEQPAITDFSVDAGSNPAFGDLVQLAADLLCSDSVRVLRSYDGVTWDTLAVVPAVPGTGVGSSVTAEATLACPPDLLCGSSEPVTVRFRLADAVTGVLSPEESVPVPVPQLQVRLDDSASMSRRRTIAWNPEDFPCGTLNVALVSADGERMLLASDVPAANGEYSFLIRSTESNAFRVQLCCSDETNPSCGYGLSARFEIPELPRGNYVAPNPYNPSTSAHAAGAVIVYTLDAPGAVSITIVDASRAVVRQLLNGEQQETGRQSIQWDGTNSRGEIVSGGTYICIIRTGSGEQILLPIIVTKR